MATREILYIEDNFHNRRIVRKILERQGYTLFECEDGLEGYEMLKAMKPGVVLLDISLPSMDGMEIAGRVKADPELKHIYLLALTASAMQGDRERFLEGGCDDYMSKPFRALDLVEMVNKYAELAGDESVEEAEEPVITPAAEVAIEEKEPAAIPVEPIAIFERPADQSAEPADSGSLEKTEEPTAEPAAEIQNVEQEPAVTPVEADVILESAAAAEAAELETGLELETAPKPASPETVEVVQTEEAPEIEDAQPADTAQLVLDPPEAEPAWAIAEAESATEPASPAEADVEAVEPTGASAAAAEAGAEGNPAQSEAGPTRSDDEKQSKNGGSIDAIRAGIMGVINSDNIKPVAPNISTGQLREPA